MANVWEPFLVAGPTKDADGMTSFTVEYRKDGEETLKDEMRIDRFSVEWLKNFVREKVATLNHVPESVEAGKIDTTVPAPPAETPAQIWRRDFGRYQQANALVGAGVIPANNAKFLALKTRLKDNFLPEYIDFV